MTNGKRDKFVAAFLTFFFFIGELVDTCVEIGNDASIYEFSVRRVNERGFVRILARARVFRPRQFFHIVLIVGERNSLPRLGRQPKRRTANMFRVSSDRYRTPPNAFIFLPFRLVWRSHTRSFTHTRSFPFTVSF